MEKARIIYLSEDHLSAEVVRTVARAAGFDIIAVLDEERMMSLSIDVFNLLITDLFSEDSDRIELFRKLRSKNFTGKILALGFIELPNSVADILDDLHVRYIIQDFGPIEFIKIITDSMG